MAAQVQSEWLDGPIKSYLGPGCWNKGTVIHELGHATGLWHEQNRPDRDQYVKVHWDNIPDAVKSQFNKASSKEIDSLGTKYDYRSIMQYTGTAFGIKKNGKQLTTMETVNPYYQDIIGKGSGLSLIDIKQLNLMHQCPPYTGKFPLRKQTDTCYDADEYCSRRVPEKGCKDKQVQKLCRFTCNLCATGSGTDPLPTFPSVTIPPKWTPYDPNPDCPFKDVWSNCKDVKSLCHQGGSWGERMKINCRKTCNFCGQPSSLPVTTKPKTVPATNPPAATTTLPSVTSKPPVSVNPACRDTIGNCPSLKKFCENSGWVHILRTRCPRTCGFC